MDETGKGVLLAMTACIIWGIAPIYFKFIQYVPAIEILTHRIIWSFFFMLILISLYRLWPKLKLACQHPKKLLALAMTALLIGCNWLLYIWAVNNNHLLEASLGYFINPLVSVLLGLIFLGERFRGLQWVALLLAMCGILVQLWTFGSIPMIALGLAFSFSFYSLLRKKIGIDAQIGMLVETLWLFPLATLYLFVIADSPTSDMTQNSLSLNLMLMFAGILTTVPLLFFTAAANRLRLSTLGFFLYLGPIIMFFLAILLYGEMVTEDKLVTFSFIWAALALFITDAVYTQRRTRKRLKAQNV